MSFTSFGMTCEKNANAGLCLLRREERYIINFYLHYLKTIMWSSFRMLSLSDLIASEVAALEIKWTSFR